MNELTYTAAVSTWTSLNADNNGIKQDFPALTKIHPQSI